MLAAALSARLTEGCDSLASWTRDPACYIMQAKDARDRKRSRPERQRHAAGDAWDGLMTVGMFMATFMLGPRSQRLPMFEPS